MPRKKEKGEKGGRGRKSEFDLPSLNFLSIF